jgi:hypothetical protein
MSEPLHTFLNYSGGKQSTAILWMILRGDLPRPEHFTVLNADPGMEDSRTYEHVQMMFEQCEMAGIEAFTVDGPNLYEDLLSLPERKIKSFKNPPYWTIPRNEEQAILFEGAARGKRGRLKQKCTETYKIAPMDRAVRMILERDHGISRKTSRIPENCVEKIIGFSFDEVSRMKPAQQKYVYFSYPLIDRRLGNDDVHNYYIENGLPIPPRSVCNACFANGIDHFKDMYENRPEDWNQAVSVDDIVRDGLMAQGVKDYVYVSGTCVPLRALAENGFDRDGIDAANWSCDSGYCFT